MPNTPQATATPVHNMGVSESIIVNSALTYSLDWLRFTADYNLPLRDCLPKHPAFETSTRNMPGITWYDRTIGLVCGRIDYAQDKPAQKKLITLAGSDLQRAREMGVSEQELIRYVITLPGFHATRVDLCCDLRSELFRDPLDILTAFIAGQCATKARSANRIDNWITGGEREGCTVYIGSRESLTFMRVYDKRAQMGGGGFWTRIEVETKGDVAGNVCNAIAKHGVIAVTKESIRRFIRTGVLWFDDAGGMDTDAQLIDPSEHRAGDFEVWIKDICLPALARALRERMPGVPETMIEMLSASGQNGRVD